MTVSKESKTKATPMVDEYYQDHPETPRRWRSRAIDEVATLLDLGTPEERIRTKMLDWVMTAKVPAMEQNRGNA